MELYKKCLRKFLELVLMGNINMETVKLPKAQLMSLLYSNLR